MIPPEATYDVLVVVDRLERVVRGVTHSEVFLFSYLSCLLFVYSGSPAAEWGYRFAATSTQAPYSEDLASAVDLLIRSGLILEGPSGLSVSPSGSDERIHMRDLSRLRHRAQYLEAATGSALAMPLPQVGAFLGGEPQLRRALELSSMRPLLDEAGAAALHDHFAALAQAVPESADLLSPAIVWLTYLGSTLDGNDAGLS